MSKRAVQVRITGHVQGVNFRAWTREQAEKRGLSGWVQNCNDGSVEALFAGPAGTVDEMLELCREGPMPARVDSVQSREIPDAPASGGFTVRR